MVTQLIQHERIQTTTAKAKELRKVADRVVTYAKKVRVAGSLQWQQRQQQQQDQKQQQGRTGLS
jgi:ribosomal protein L17